MAALYALTGMEIKLSFKNPSQLDRNAMVTSAKKRTERRRDRRPQEVSINK